MFSIVVVINIFFDPSKFSAPVTSPVKFIVLSVRSLVAVLAFPVIDV
jgi:hypothetical protein